MTLIPASKPSSGENVFPPPPELVFTRACHETLRDGAVTPDESRRLDRLRKELRISKQQAVVLFKGVMVERRKASESPPPRIEELRAADPSPPPASPAPPVLRAPDVTRSLVERGARTRATLALRVTGFLGSGVALAAAAAALGFLSPAVGFLALGVTGAAAGAILEVLDRQQTTRIWKYVLDGGGFASWSLPKDQRATLTVSGPAWGGLGPHREEVRTLREVYCVAWTEGGLLLGGSWYALPRAGRRVYLERRRTPALIVEGRAGIPGRETTTRLRIPLPREALSRARGVAEELAGDGQEGAFWVLAAGAMSVALVLFLALAG